MLSTIQKINLVKVAYHLVTVVRKILGKSSKNIKVTRSGIRWHLDLTESIDFSIYILGSFEYSVLSSGEKTLEKFKPNILMELVPSLFKNQRNEFIQMIELYKKNRVFFYDANNRSTLPVDAEKLFDLMPDGVSRNIIATVSV
jgi:hypothetical protein